LIARLKASVPGQPRAISPETDMTIRPFLHRGGLQKLCVARYPIHNDPNHSEHDRELRFITPPTAMWWIVPANCRRKNAIPGTRKKNGRADALF